MTVAELLERMSSREFSEWMAYAGIEPFGEERADLRQAMTTSAIHNSVQAQAKHPKWTKPGDFMPFSKQDTPAVGSADDLRANAAPELLHAKLLAFAPKSKLTQE